ncbi:MAG: hypothetical protein GWN18_05190 [Thermoplasmata archaeon]|nr:hypothetical protein [Thermoplasmata archaeon]NIT76468.1 hypothetical protein [Thermoplasmata archaeon]NIW81973.1 hypothetical protein [Thermoplasmata archaeon]NIY02839.1 hypothetical protein [Thermoplasmata archaeon]
MAPLYRWRALIGMLVVASLLVAGTAAGERKEGDDVLVAGEHKAIEIVLEEGEEVEVRVFVAVTDGPKIDVFWMSEEGYDDYQFDEDFNHYVDYSVVGSKNVDKTFLWDGEGTYFVVIDNTASETVPPADPEFSNATLHYVVTWGPPEEVMTARDYATYAVIAIVVVFAVLLAVRYVRLSR